MMQVKALSIRQPWAELIISGRKTIEVREWSDTYRGKVWLHVPQKKDDVMESYYGYKGLVTGCYIGYFSIISIRPFTLEKWQSWRSRHLDPGPFKPGLYAWDVTNPVRFIEPVKGGGFLKLFSPDFQITNLLESAPVVSNTL